MRFLHKMKLAKKLPLIITLPTVFFVVLFGTAQIWQSINVKNKELRTVYSALAQERAQALARWLRTIENDMTALTANSAVHSALSAFSKAWDQLGSAPQDQLRDYYISSNPHPVGEKDQLVTAGDGSVWSIAHQLHHPGLRTFQRVHGYYDLFLFDVAGNLIYSVFKEDDFALNFASGRYATSGLGDAFQQSVGLKDGQIYMTTIAPYAPSAGAPALFLAAPVYQEGTQLGVVALQVPFDEISKILSDSRLLGETGRVILTDSDGSVLSQSHADGSAIHKSTMSGLPQIQTALAGETEVFVNAKGTNGQPVVAATGALETIRGDRWGILVEINSDEALAGRRSLMLSLVIGVIATALTLTLTSILVGRNVARRFVSLAEDIREVATENYDVTVRGTETNDEIGEIAQTLEGFKSHLQAGSQAKAREAEIQEGNRKVVRLLGNAMMNLAAGDFRNRITEFFPIEHKSLRYQVNDAMAELSDVVSQVSTVTGRIATSANEMNEAADDLSRRTEGQAATLEETAAALEEVTVNMSTSAQNVRTVDTAVADAKTEAQQSGSVVTQTVTAMTEIEKSSKQIAQIIGVIDDIAFQTNLLALNAGVEAARAGEAGRGFAVVASEVRALAQRASDAAMEIKSLIQDSTQHVDQGVMLVGQTGTALKSIEARVTHIADLMTEITASAEAQATALNEINGGMAQLDQVTQGNAAMVEENTAASQLLQQDSSHLAQLMSKFKTESDADSLAKPVKRIAPSCVPLQASTVGENIAESEIATPPAKAVNSN